MVVAVRIVAFGIEYPEFRYFQRQLIAPNRITPFGSGLLLDQMQIVIKLLKVEKAPQWTWHTERHLTSHTE